MPAPIVLLYILPKVMLNGSRCLWLLQLYEQMKFENERLQKDLQKVQQEVTEGSTRNDTSRSTDLTIEKRVSDVRFSDVCPGRHR